MSRAENLEKAYEPRPDPQSLTSNPSNNSSSGVDYEPHPEKSIQIPADRERIVKSITSLYSGSASEEDMQVYAAEAVYDDPWSYCDTRYKIAGQWYGMQVDFLFSSSIHARCKYRNARLSSCLMFRIYMLTATLFNRVQGSPKSWPPRVPSGPKSSPTHPPSSCSSCGKNTPHAYCTFPNQSTAS